MSDAEIVARRQVLSCDVARKKRDKASGEVGEIQGNRSDCAPRRRKRAENVATVWA